MFQSLSDEILLMILSSLSIGQLAKVKRVCKKLNQLVTPQLMEKAVQYVNYRGSPKISDKLNFFSWDTKADMFQQMKTNLELRTNFGLGPSKFTVTHQNTIYIIQDAVTKKPLGYFGNDCHKLNNDQKLPMLNNLQHSLGRISILIQENYILISDCMNFIYLFDGKNFISEDFWSDNHKAIQKAREKLDDKAESLFQIKTKKEDEKTVAILSLGEKRYLTISKFGEIREWLVTSENNEHKISPTSSFSDIGLSKESDTVAEPTQVQRAIFTQNDNILLTCSDYRVKILNTNLELIKGLNMNNYKKKFKDPVMSIAHIWGMYMDPKPEDWPLLESLSKYNLIIIPPISDQILVIDETKDFAIHSTQLPEITSINLGVILTSGQILLVTETDLKLKDIEIYFPDHNQKSTSSRCNIS